MKKLLLMFVLIPSLLFGQITITNTGNSIKVVKSGSTVFSEHKSQAAFEVVGAMVYFKTGGSSIYNARYSEIDSPVTANISDLLDTLNSWSGAVSETELKFADGTALKQVDGKIRTSSMPYTYDIAEGNISDHTALYKFGSNPDIGTAEETIWQEGGLYPWDSVSAAAGVVKLSSSSTLDQAGIAQVETQTIVGTDTVSGNLQVIITSAILVTSPDTLLVAIDSADTAPQVAAKIIARLDTTTVITDFYSIGGTGSDFTLTALTKATDDGTLNIEIADGTSSGITADATSVNTTTGVAFSTGAWTATIYGLSSVDSTAISETLTLNGQTGVNSTLSYYRVNRIICNTAGTGLKNAGIVYVGTGDITTGKPAVVWSSVAAGKNQTLQSIWTVPADMKLYITSFFASTNSNKGNILNIYVRPLGELFQIKSNVYLFSNAVSNYFDLPLVLQAGTDIDCRAIGTATGAGIQFSFSGWTE